MPSAPSSMTNNPKVAQKALRIQLPSSSEEPLSACPRPGTTPMKVTRKSILKNRCDEPRPTLTGEHDPLQSESYFQGPLRTLIASVENGDSGMLSVHDITEAYILLSCRIEAEAPNLKDEAPPAVAAIQKLTSRLLCTAIRRDVVRAISGSGESEDVQSDQALLDEEGRSRVRDRSSLCHAALRFLANFFRFRILHSLLKLHELAWILKEVIDVGLSQDLSTLNPQKTYSHVIAILSGQRLPESVLRPFRSKIATIIERAASGVMEGGAVNGPHLDGLRANYYLLHRHGPLLFSEFCKVLKVVLQNLVCPVPAFRDLAAKSLTAFAHAVLRSKITTEDQLKYSTIVGAFIDKEERRAGNMSKRDSDSFVLRDFFKLKEDDPRIIQRVTQLLNIASSLLVLSGPCVFTRPTSLKFLVKAVGKTQPFRQRELNLLRAAAWSCLVRSYGLIPIWGIPKDDGLEESAFRIIRQEYRDNVGVSVIAVLLGPFQGHLGSVSRVQEAITYLYHLGEMPETRDIAAILFRRLLGGVLNDADSETCTWVDPSSVIPDWLSSGMTLELDPRKLRKALMSLPDIDILTVRILEADELVLTWEGMVEAFQTLAIGRLFDKESQSSLQDDSLMLWRALLKVQSALVPSFSRGIVSKSTLSCIASTLCAFLEATHARYPIRSFQSLSATLQLWKIVNEELGELWAAAVAGSIYRRLLKIWQFDISANAMSDDWAQLSRALILAAPKRTLEILGELDDIHAERVVWLDMVRHVRFMEHPPKDVLSNLLLLPIRSTEPVLKDEMDFSHWDILFMLALMHDEPENVYATVADGLSRALSVNAAHDLRMFFKTSITHSSRSDASPSLALLSVTSDYLEDAYPPENCEDNELIDIVPALQRIIHSFPSLAILKALMGGLIPWFQDKRTLLPDAIYNDDVLRLYCDLSIVIRKVRPIEDTIVELADLLAAPFSRERIPKPATGPMAFKEFWDDIAPTLDFGSRKFPLNLTDCVISLHNAFGGYVPEWMESQLDSLPSHSSDVEMIIPPSVDDIESSDFSPTSLDRAKAQENMRTPTRQHVGKTTPGRTPEVSPSIGEPSPQFARYRPNVNLPSPPVFFDVERVSKKRKLQPAAGAGTSPSREHDVDMLQSGEILLSPPRIPGNKGSELDHPMFTSPEAGPSTNRLASSDIAMSDEDYSTWEIAVGSQDVRNALQDDGDDGQKTPRPGDFPLERCDLLESGVQRRRDSARGSEHRIDRSQTAPATLQTMDGHHSSVESPSGQQSPAHAKLRRTHTTSAVPLDALEKLHAELSEGSNYMETQDLAHATKLTYDVLGLLNGKMSEKLGNRK